MSRGNDLPLQRLLRRREATSLLESFADLAPDLGLALVGDDRRPLARAGCWPDGTLEKILAATAAAFDGSATVPEVVELDDGRCYPLLAGSRLLGTLVASGPSPATCEGVGRVLHRTLTAVLLLGLEKREIASEALDGYREINLLYRVGETVGRSLDPKAIPELVLEQSRLIKADVGLVLLSDEDPAAAQTKASFGGSERVKELREALRGCIHQLWESTRSVILTDLPGTAASYGAVLWMPLRTSERAVGGIVVAREPGQPMFTAADEKLLAALAGPSALALENARLFNQTLETKTLMNNTFASMASGLLTTDTQGQITLCNRAAAQMLGLSQTRAVGEPLRQMLPESLSRLNTMTAASVKRGAVVLGEEFSAEMPDRGPLHLHVSCTPVRDAQQGMTGAAIVIENRTEQRKAEADRERIRQTFGKVVAPRVRDRLLADAAHLHLDGTRHTITVLFADLHNFTTFAERTAPETLFKVLNSYLSLAAQAVLDEEGTLDKFLGDAVMAFWNAPDAQPDHARRAVRAAVAIERAIEAHRGLQEESHQLQFSIGITTGEAIVGNVGTSELFNYTAIGDTVNLAQRLESIAEPGCILLSEATYREVAQHVNAEARAPVQVKGRTQAALVYELAGLTA
ncbi:MAG TPA: adenylate/guanylate cyclase domain-containing protein [Dehalococcoidia bacterium]